MYKSVVSIKIMQNYRFFKVATFSFEDVEGFARSWHSLNQLCVGVTWYDFPAVLKELPWAFVAQW